MSKITSNLFEFLVVICQIVFSLSCHYDSFVVQPQQLRHIFEFVNRNLYLTDPSVREIAEQNTAVK